MSALNSFMYKWRGKRLTFVEERGECAAEYNSLFRSFSWAFRKDCRERGLKVLSIEKTYSHSGDEYGINAVVMRVEDGAMFFVSMPNVQAPSAFDKVIYRSIPNEKDVRGGRNRYSDLNALPSMLKCAIWDYKE